MGRPRGTRCARGHELTEVNTRLTKKGRECRTCYNARARQRRSPTSAVTPDADSQLPRGNADDAGGRWANIERSLVQRELCDVRAAKLEIAAIRADLSGAHLLTWQCRHGHAHERRDEADSCVADRDQFIDSGSGVRAAPLLATYTIT